MTVFFRGDRVVKVTHEGAWGLFPRFERTRDGTPFFCPAGRTASARYLARIRLQQQYLGDDTRFEGILQDGRLVTSQPLIVGDPATLAQIGDLLKSLDFMSFPGPQHHWFHEEGVILMDAHEGNFIATPSGEIVPIDTAMAMLTGRQLAVARQIVP